MTGFIVDSTTVLTDELKKYDIEVVSLYVTIKDVSKKETEMEDSEVLSNLKDVGLMKSACPSVGDYEIAFDNMLKKYDDIIVVPLAKELSGSYQAAMLARNNRENIYIVDAKTCNFAITNVLEEVLAKKDEYSAKELYEITTRLCNNSLTEFTIANIKHLVAGGRLNKIAGTIGNLLKIKPVVRVVDGKLKLDHISRTLKGAIDTMNKNIKEYLEKFKKITVKIVNLGNEEEAKKMTLDLSAYEDIKVSNITKIGPVFHVHLGDAGIGITVCESL